MSEMLARNCEMPDEGRLHPHSLEFLQSVYGADQRLDALKQPVAEELTAGLLDMYGKHHEYPSQYEQPEHNPVYEQAATTVSAFVQGAKVADIVPLDHNYRDPLDVEIVLNDVAYRLRRHEAEVRRKTGGHSPLEELLQTHADDADVPRGRHIVPLGKLLWPIIEHSRGTEAWTSLEQELQSDAKRVEELQLERLAAEAEAAVAEYAATEEFKRAAARKGHEKNGEVFVMGPGDDDPDSQVLRHMSWLVSTAVFARKDGNNLHDMQEHRNDDYDFHFLAVDHSQGDPRPMGALYTKMQSEDSLPSVQDIWYEWHEPVRQVTMEAGLPDLRYYSRTLDVLTVAVLPEYDQGGANLVLYNRLGVLCDTLGVEYIVNIFDQGPADQLNHFGNAFHSYNDRIKPQNYKARRTDANSSLPRYAYMPAWQADMRQNRPRVAVNFWGEQPPIGSRYQLPDLSRFRRLQPGGPDHRPSDN